MRRGVAIKKAPPKPKSFKEYVETMLSETPPWALYEEGGETALDYSPYDHPKLKNVKDKKRADEISRELLDKPTWRPRLLEPENVVFVPKLEDRLDSVIDDPLIRYGKKFAKPFENVIRQGKRLVDPKLIRPKTSVQTTLPQHFPRLTTENPYDKEGRIKPGAIAPITAFKQMGRDAFNNLLSYGLIPGLTVDSLDWEESSNLRDMTPIPVKSGASFVAPVGTLDAIRGTMNQSGGRGKPIYVGIRGFAQPEDKAFLRTDSREPIEAAALGRIPPERLVLPFNIAQSGEEFGSPLSFEEWRDASKRPKSFEKFVEKIQGPKYLPLLLNAGYTQEIDDYRQLWNDRQNTQRMDYEKYLQDMKNYSIRTNLLNQRLAELGENFPPLTAKNFPMEGGRRNPYDTLYDGIYEDDFPKTIADTKNTKVRQALGAVPKEWSQNTKFNLMNPALSDAEREAIRREFQENADHEIHMSSRHDGTVDPANFNRITRGLMSAIYGPQASNMIDFRNNVGDAYSERGEKIGLEMNNPAAASLGLPNTWNAPQLFNPNFNPNQSVIKAPRITAYSPREIRDIVPDLQGIRYIPKEYLESAGKPIRVHSGGKRGIGQSYDWEQDLQRLKYGLPQSGNFPKGKISEPKPLTGLFEEDKFVPKYNLAQREMVMSPVESGNIVAGQFMHPPVKEALRVPDFSANLHRPMALTGILEQPQFMREGYEGSNLLGEGFHYGELEPDSVVQLKLPYNIQPLEMARVASMREYDSPKNQRDKETMNWLSHIPSMSVPTSTEWWKQQGATEMTAPQLEQAGLFQAGEPMDIAMQLLKQEPADYADTFHRVRNNIGVDGEYMTDEELNAIDRRYSELHDDENHLEEYFNLLEMIELEQMRRRNQSFEGMGYNEETGFTRSQPMDIAMQLLKREMSPEARQHKLEYDKKYESTPERVKYREELNRERRKRGIYGSGDHMDVSHTEGGKLTLEGEHENRARHFKERGTLRPSKIAVRKDN